MRISNLLIFSVASLLVTGCKLEPDIPEPQPGEADLSRYIAIGDGLTAGFANGGLYREAQQNSFPAIMARQLLEAGGGDFGQPLLPEGNGSGYQYLAGFNESGIPLVKEKQADPAFPEKVTGDFQNLAIPQMRVKDIASVGYGNSNGNGNPFFYRLLGAGEENKTYLEWIAKRDPSFFTCWLGMQDVLGYATTGGIYGTSGNNGSNGITDPSKFEMLYKSLLDTLTKDDAHGMVMNLPDILDFAFFNGLPKQLIDVTNQDQLDLLNRGYGLFNYLVDLWNADHPDEQYEHIVWEMGPNYPVIYDEEVPADLYHRRRLKPGEYILLTVPFDSLQPIDQGGRGWGTQNGIPPQYILDEEDVQNIKDAQDAYNQIIQQLAASNDNVTLFDMKAYYESFQPQILNDGEVVSFGFISGGFFSLDGIHLTPKGNAFLANGVIEKINQQYEATVSPVIASQYRGVLFPE